MLCSYVDRWAFVVRVLSVSQGGNANCFGRASKEAEFVLHLDVDGSLWVGIWRFQFVIQFQHSSRSSIEVVNGIKPMLQADQGGFEFAESLRLRCDIIRVWQSLNQELIWHGPLQAQQGHN